MTYICSVKTRVRFKTGPVFSDLTPMNFLKLEILQRVYNPAANVALIEFT